MSPERSQVGSKMEAISGGRHGQKEKELTRMQYSGAYRTVFLGV